MASSLRIILLLSAVIATMVLYGRDPGKGKGRQPFNASLQVSDSLLEFNLTSTEADPIVTADTASSVLPFSRAGNLIVIRATIDGEEGNFILDTGAPKLVLNTTYFRRYMASGTETESGGITGSMRSTNTTIPALKMGAINYFRIDADLISLGHLENSKGIPILGLLGMQLFKRFEMIIDYEHSVIHLHLISRREASSYKSDQLSDTTRFNEFPIKLSDNKLLAIGKMGSRKLTFIIDTGAESNVLDSRLPEKVFDEVTITGRVVLAGSGDTKIEALYGELKNMKLGNIYLAALPVLVTNLEKMCYSYERCLDGMLGFDFLSMHKVAFNFVQGKMYIWR